MTLPFQKRWPSRRFVFFTIGLCVLPLAIIYWGSRTASLPPAIPYKFPTRELEELDRSLHAPLGIALYC